MVATFDDFPHHGEHLRNDHMQAEATLTLLSAFVLALVLIAIALL